MMKIVLFTIYFMTIFNRVELFSQSINNDEMPGNNSEQGFFRLPDCVFYPTDEKENIDSNQNLLLIPNAFTPNGDGLNDNFKIFCNFCKSFKLIIYDILGNKLFESDDPSHLWDGNYKNKQCKNGAYIWMITYKTMAGIQNSKMGSLTLIK